MSGATALSRMFSPFAARITGMVARAVLSAVKDDQKLQKLAVEALAGYPLDGIESFGLYGVFGVPPVGTDIILINKGGKWLAVAQGDRKFRPKGWKQGDSGLYDDKQQKVHLSGNGIALEDKNGNKATMDSAGITLETKGGTKCEITNAGFKFTNGVADFSGCVELILPASSTAQFTKYPNDFFTGTPIQAKSTTGA